MLKISNHNQFQVREKSNLEMNHSLPQNYSLMRKQNIKKTIQDKKEVVQLQSNTTTFNH